MRDLTSNFALAQYRTPGIGAVNFVMDAKSAKLHMKVIRSKSLHRSAARKL